MITSSVVLNLHHINDYATLYLWNKWFSSEHITPVWYKKTIDYSSIQLCKLTYDLLAYDTKPSSVKMKWMNVIFRLNWCYVVWLAMKCDHYHSSLFKIMRQIGLTIISGNFDGKIIRLSILENCWAKSFLVHNLTKILMNYCLTSSYSFSLHPPLPPPSPSYTNILININLRS